MTARLRDYMKDGPEGLSSRQVEILTCVSEGLSNKQIAAKLFLSENTVKSHMKLIRDRLDIHGPSVVGVIYAAVRQGILPCPCGARSAHERIH